MTSRFGLTPAPRINPTHPGARLNRQFQQSAECQALAPPPAACGTFVTMRLQLQRRAPGKPGLGYLAGCILHTAVRIRNAR